MSDINWKGLAKEAAKEIESLRGKLAERDKELAESRDVLEVAKGMLEREAVLKQQLTASQEEARGLAAAEKKKDDLLSSLALDLDHIILRLQRENALDEDESVMLNDYHERLCDAQGTNAKAALDAVRREAEEKERLLWAEAFDRLVTFFNPGHPLILGLQQASCDLRLGPLPKDGMLGRRKHPGGAERVGESVEQREPLIVENPSVLRNVHDQVQRESGNEDGEKGTGVKPGD